jgi:cyclophilin family peptidyl-prolyl cis-trans isomerase
MRLSRLIATIAVTTPVACATVSKSSGPSTLNAAADVWATGSAVPVLPGHPVVPTTAPSTPANSPLLHPDDPFWLAQAPATFRVRVETSRGPFTMELTRALAPIGVDHFYNLVRAGYYNDSRFSRSNAGWIAQFGLARDSQVTATWLSHPIKDDSVRGHNDRATFTYAMRKPDDRTVEISISRRDNRVQDAQGFAPLGTIIQGMDVVDSLYFGYGETSGGGVRAGKQGEAIVGGNAWFDAHYPRLDHLIRMTIIPVSK